MTIARYDEIADWYDGWVGGEMTHADPVFVAILDLPPDLTDLPILDLTCGQGRMARYLADQHARHGRGHLRADARLRPSAGAC